MVGEFEGFAGLGYTLTFNPGSNSTQDLGFTLNITGAAAQTPPFVMASLKVAAEANEAFWGFGEQFTYLNQRGQLLRLMNMEQGIFRGIQPESAAINVNTPGTAGDWYTSYVALPQYISSAGRALFFENYEAPPSPTQLRSPPQIL